MTARQQRPFGVFFVGRKSNRSWWLYVLAEPQQKAAYGRAALDQVSSILRREGRDAAGETQGQHLSLEHLFGRGNSGDQAH